MGAVTIRKGLDDGEAEPAAPFGGVRAAMEAVERTLAIGRRNSRSCIDDLERGPGGLVVRTHPYLPSLGGVAHRIVDEVAHQDTQRLGIPLHRCGIGLEAE